MADGDESSDVDQDDDKPTRRYSDEPRFTVTVSEPPKESERPTEQKSEQRPTEQKLEQRPEQKPRESRDGLGVQEKTDRRTTEEKRAAAERESLGLERASMRQSASALLMQMPPPDVKPVTRYFTLKVRKLPRLDLLTKTNPIVAVWDSISKETIGSTEWVKGHCNADFQEVIAVQHYPGMFQDLHINVFNTLSKQIRQKDFLGKAIMQLDLMVSTGNEIRVALTNPRDAKMDARLKKRRSCVLMHMKEDALTANVLKSGWVMTREGPLITDTTARRPSLFGRDKPSSTPWTKRFLVVKPGELTHYEFVKDFFAPHPACVRIDLSSAEVVLEESCQFVGAKNLLEHHQDAWQVMLERIGRTHEFDLVREPPPTTTTAPATPNKLAQPVTPEAKKVRSSSDAAFAFGVGNDSYQETDKHDWLRATCVAMPTKVFGVPLVMAAQRSDSEEKLIPAPIRVATNWINAHALDEEGLYRVPGSKEQVEAYIKLFDRGVGIHIPEQSCGGNLASVVVQYIRRLPESIFTDRLEPVFAQVCAELMRDDSKKFMLKKLISKLPPAHFCTLRMLTDHLVKVSQHSEINQMTEEKLAMCVLSTAAQSLQALCRHHRFLFDQPVPLEAPGPVKTSTPTTTTSTNSATSPSPATALAVTIPSTSSPSPASPSSSPSSPSASNDESR